MALRLGQFKHTLTEDDDFVIGDPATVGSHTVKSLVFLSSGVAGDPHPRIESAWNSTLARYELELYAIAGAAKIPVLDLARQSVANSFSGTNTFNGITQLAGTTTLSGTTSLTGPSTITGLVSLQAGLTSTAVAINLSAATVTLPSNISLSSPTISGTIAGNISFSGDVTFNGTVTTVNTQTLDVKDSNITVNKGGTWASADGAGMTVFTGAGNEEAGLRYSTTDAGWVMQVRHPSDVGDSKIAVFVPNGTISTKLTLPASSGTLALQSDIPSVAGYLTKTQADTYYLTKAQADGYYTASGKLSSKNIAALGASGSYDGLYLPTYNSGTDSISWISYTPTNVAYLTTANIFTNITTFSQQVKFDNAASAFVIKDKLNGKYYSITIENGVYTQTEVV